MKNFKQILYIFSCMTAYFCGIEKFQMIDLSGQWQFGIDSLDQEISKEWYAREPGIKLPGSMAENGKGYDITLNTLWTTCKMIVCG